MVSSSVGCITEQEAPGGAYGASKAALNWITRALHNENERGGLVAVALHPGWVQTRAGAHAASEWGFQGRLPETVEGSVRGMLEVIDRATRENVSGKCVTYKGGGAALVKKECCGGEGDACLQVSIIPCLWFTPESMRW
ncbi:short chain dehydrogenase/reductase family oxidoreductase [Apiospora phragmitis]|uniref:Short chain dehydrogenase/reductase family oxidoreductase n=1 Tax=Apiospora phragmitis TaxID=2905665 RepID=A0ABR1TB88_9PEZI